MKTYDFDEILAQRSPAAQAAIESRYQELLSTFPLSALRTDCGLSQSDVGVALNISQAAVSKMEARSDMLLSTVFRYVKAINGRIRVSVSVEDSEYLIEPSKVSSKGFVLQKEQRVSPASLFPAVKDSAKQLIHPKPNEAHGRWTLQSSLFHDVVREASAGTAANDCHYFQQMFA